MQELHELHAQLLLAVVRGHGIAAAMGLVGQSLQSLAARHAEEYSSANGVGIVVNPGLRSRRRWASACQLALRAAKADPWQGLFESVPMELALRRRWLPDGGWTSEAVLVRVERAAFARGAMRTCHRIKILQSARSGWQGAGCNHVAKLYEGDPDSPALLEEDVRLQQAAKRYAARYNERGVPKAVDFVECSVVRVSARGATYAVEPFLAGAFTKYSSNSGFVTDEVLRNTPHAFSHYTFEASGGEELVVDVQGVGDLLTDPQIHTRDGAGRGRGNMGLRCPGLRLEPGASSSASDVLLPTPARAPPWDRGMALFFANHRCNALCRQLRCRPFARLPEPGSTASATVPAAPAGAARSLDFDAASPPQPPRFWPAPPAAPGAAAAPSLSPSTALVVQPRPEAAAASPPGERVVEHAPIHFALALLHARAVRAHRDKPSRLAPCLGPDPPAPSPTSASIARAPRPRGAGAIGRRDDRAGLARLSRARPLPPRRERAARPRLPSQRSNRRHSQVGA